MNNTYIQNKLDDTFRKIGKVSNIHPEIIDEFILLKNEALTDYHNHIVEKIDNIHPINSNNAIDHHMKIKSLLQDTSKDNV